MPSQKRQFGDSGEEAAVQFLKKKGYRILERNFLQKGGEIDIVAAKTRGLFGGKIEEIIFAEVKTISGDKKNSFLAAQNVHYFKKQRLIRTAQSYLWQKKIPSSTPWRIDVLLVARGASGTAEIEHLENAVWAK